MRIALLGPLQVRDEAGTPVSIGGRQLRVLLILLALAAGRVVPAGTLADELWRDERPADPGNALQTLVSRLRAALRGADCAALLESHPAGYRLAVPPDAVDALEFRALAATGRRALTAGDALTAARVLRDALGLWRGPALADAQGCEATEAAAVSLAELREDAAQDRIEAELVLGEAMAVIGELKSMVSADPLAERPRALLMRALAAAGRQAEALAAFTEARGLLADQLGVDPSPALEQVYLRILRGEEAPAPGSPPPRAVPVPITSFVGRDNELSRLLKLLRESVRLVTLTGPGGVGKTRLATEVTGHLEARACFVPLAPVTDSAEVPYAILDALGIRGPVIGRRTGESDATSGPLDRLTAALGSRDDVLILDNCEHVIEEAAAVAARVLADCPRVRIVATSREPLRIDGETLCPVPPLAFPPPADLFPASYASVRLLADRAAAVQPGFQVDDGNAEAVARICRTLDGMPLAIELAAVWLRMLSPAQLAERLADRFALLTGGSRTALPRHQTLRAVVDWSWDLLSEPERVLARRLSVFPDGATLTAAERVCADDGPAAADVLARADVLASLSGLVDKSILSVTGRPGDAGPRYRMLETVRAYCLERLSAAGEARQVRDAFSEHYLTLVETADPLLRAAGQRRWLLELTAEQDNIYGALRWLIASRDVVRALRLIRALSWFWMLRGQAGEPATLAHEVLALGPGPGTMQMAEARVMCALMAAGPAWDIDGVRDDLTAALTALAEWSADWSAFHPIAALAEPVVALFDGDPERAQALLNRFDTAADPWVRASAGMLRASFAALLGHTADVEGDVRRALAAFREMGETWGMAGALLELAKFAGLRGDHTAEAASLEEAVALGRELGAWGDLPQIDAKLASVRIRMGDLAGAREDLERAEHGDASLGTDRLDSAAYLSVVRAELSWREGDNEQTARHYGKALDWLGGQKSAWFQAWRAQVQARLGVVLLESGEVDRSRALLADSLLTAALWIDRAALADVIDAIAVFAVRDGAVGDGAEAAAGLAATLLGVAHSIRGGFDEGGLDGPGARQRAREALGLPGFEAAYQRGRDLGFSEGLLLAADATGADLADFQSGQVLRR